MEQGPDELSEREEDRGSELEKLTNEPLNRGMNRGTKGDQEPDADRDENPEEGE